MSGTEAMDPAGQPKPRYPDFQDHLAELEARGLLRRVDRVINKDTELHPLVRWQFQGGLPESQRTAFLFTNVTDSARRSYDTVSYTHLTLPTTPYV